MCTPLSVATQTLSGVPDLLPFCKSNLHKLWDQIRSHVWLGLETRCGACLGRSGYFRVPDLTIFWAFRCATLAPLLGTPDLGTFSHFCQFWGPDFGPYLDPKNGYQKWSPIKNIRESKFWTPKTDPNLVPKTGPQNSYFWSKIGPRNGQKLDPKMDKKLGPKNESKAGSQNWGPKMGPKNGPRDWAQNWTQQSSPVDLKTAPKTESRIWVSQQTPICVFRSQCQKNRAAERKMFASRPNLLNRSRRPNTPRGTAGENACQAELTVKIRL